MITSSGFHNNHHRSQSFKHKTKTDAIIEEELQLHQNIVKNQQKKNGDKDGCVAERRRSTPSICRRASLGYKKRIDVWPEPKQLSEVEERFLRLPDSEDYRRVRQFKIDEKGAVISRGNSFRRKQKNSDENERSIFKCSPKNENEKHPDTNSSTQEEVFDEERIELNDNSIKNPSTSQPKNYKICVIGPSGSGKYFYYYIKDNIASRSSLIKHFIASEYRNTLNDEVDEETAPKENFVSISIGGYECDLLFVEMDIQDENWKNKNFNAFMVLYSIDRKQSFRLVVQMLEQLRYENFHMPIILVGNKIDLERKRAVSPREVREISLKYSIPNFEVSALINVEVDELLVGIVAQLKDAFVMNSSEGGSLSNSSKDKQPADDFNAAIRRYSHRKKRQMGMSLELEINESKCANLNPLGLFNRFCHCNKNGK